YVANPEAPAEPVQPAQAFSPGDASVDNCTNEILNMIFHDLVLDPVTQQAYALQWDGKNDLGEYVGNGLYQIVVTSVDAQSGKPVTANAWVTIGAKRTEVVARIFNAAGEEVAVLAPGKVGKPVAKIEVRGDGNPGNGNPFEPNVEGTHFAEIVMLDKDGNVLGTMRWYGRTCPSSPTHVCALPTDGLIVNNGVYLIAVTSTQGDGSVTTATAAVTVSHGKLEMIADVTGVPNPVSEGSLANPANKIWIVYSVKSADVFNLRVKVYNVAGELVRHFDPVVGQVVDSSQQGANPLGTTGKNAINCPTSQCGTFTWDGRNQNGVVCAAGLYIVVIEVEDQAGNLQREITKLAIE
ncbi:MAG: hypothetical protein AAB368_17330, partial [bacterium]